MGKSIRSKIKKRLRTAKRQRVDAMVLTPKLKEHHASLQRTMEGRSVTLKGPKNAFKYPEADGAVFPQHEIMKPIDFRCANLPMASFAFRGNRRKYQGEELEMMKNIAKNSHPKMEVLAGGGAISAKTGKRISKLEAELAATAAVDPEAAALAVAGPASSTSAVASAVAEDAANPAAAGSSSAAAAPASGAADGDDADMGGSDDDEDEDAAPGQDGPEPTNEADHTRRPILKDTRRAKRTKARRTRPNSALKTKLPPVPQGSVSAPGAAAAQGKKNKKKHAKAASAPTSG